MRVTLPFAYIGVLLQLLRERRGLGLLELIARFEAHGYAMSSATYADMEAGRFLLPEDGRQFIRAYSYALDLSPDEVQVLVSLWAFAILRAELGDDLAREAVGDMLSARPAAS